MQMPNVVHPRNVVVNGFTFQVVSYSVLTDQQALSVAVHFVRNHKLLKKHKKMVIQIVTTLDQESAGMFG